MDEKLKSKLLRVIICASSTVLSREGDVSTTDGTFASCGVDDIIYLEEALVELLNLPQDEITSTTVDYIKILEKQL